MSHQALSFSPLPEPKAIRLWRRRGEAQVRLTPLVAPMQRWNQQLKHASPTRTSPRPSQSLRDVPPELGAIFDLVSRGFAPAPGSAAQTRVDNSNLTTPFAKPQGRATRVGRTLALPRLR
jgi:hypothetical protein